MSLWRENTISILRMSRIKMRRAGFFFRPPQLPCRYDYIGDCLPIASAALRNDTLKMSSGRAA